MAALSEDAGKYTTLPMVRNIAIFQQMTVLKKLPLLFPVPLERRVRILPRAQRFEFRSAEIVHRIAKEGNAP
jgi:hypothetical protein